MTLAYNIDQTRRHACITGTDTVTMEGMLNVMEQVAADVQFEPHFTVILDLSEARYTANLNDGDALAAVLGKKKGDFQNKVAVVVPSSLHLIAKLYCLLSKMAGFDKVQPFIDMDEAETWCSASDQLPD